MKIISLFVLSGFPYFGEKNILINFQGTILKATNRKKSLAVKYFPHNYFSLNKSDLCLMVNDGTDGNYYAKQRGCDNIFFEPHGVLQYKHDDEKLEILELLKKTKKFILFNNASGSTWKRPDRIVRGLLKLDKDALNDIVLITTYYGPDREELIKYTKAKGLDKNVIFAEGLNNIQCNYILQNSDVVIMTNDISNLGNPILEAIFYKIQLYQ
jgi:glycosyltransferase involved in cell wall biosynthesis